MRDFELGTGDAHKLKKPSPAFALSARAMARTLLCGLTASGFLASAALGDEALPELEEILVTATRIGIELPGAVTTVIDAEEIKRSPARTLPQLLDLEAGVQSRDLFGVTAAAKATVDIRGFGATGMQNTLVLLNGRRLNDGDLSSVNWATIPVASIERIEIVRGNAGGVLYGDGAVGGVVNVVTKPASMQKPGVRMDAALGSHEYGEANVSLAQSAGRFSIDAYGSYINGGGHRTNNEIIERNLVTEVRYAGDAGDMFLQLGLHDQWLEYPGGRLVDSTIGVNELETGRDNAATPWDYGEENGIDVTTGGTRELADGVELIFDMGLRNKDQEATFSTYLDTVLTTWSVTPRLNLDYILGGFAASSIIGLDYSYADYDSDRKNASDATWHTRYDGKQHNLGLYAQNTVALTPETDLSLGLRGQFVDFSMGRLVDTTAPGGTWLTPIDAVSGTSREYAYNLGLEHRFAGETAVFGRVGRSIRLPTIDERVSTVSGTFELKTQHSRDAEVGAGLGFGPFTLRSSAYVMDLENELHFNPEGLGCSGAFCFGANENFDPTRRYGVENSATYRVSDDLKLKGNLSYTRAEFTDGPFDGNDVPLVAEWTASASLSWDVWKEYLTFSATANYTGEKRFENDERNFQPTIPDYTLVDVKLAGMYGPAHWSIEVNNLFDQDYFSYGVASASVRGRYNAYPLPGRTFLVRAGMEF